MGSELASGKGTLRIEDNKVVSHMSSAIFLHSAGHQIPTGSEDTAQQRARSGLGQGLKKGEPSALQDQEVPGNERDREEPDRGVWVE